MISIQEEILKNHSEAEAIDYVYRRLTDVQKTLDSAIIEQNLMSIGSVLPIINLSVDILREIRKQNELREAMKK